MAFYEYIFKKFTIPSLESDERLRVLSMKPLASRRIVTDDILLHKIINGALITSTTAKNEISLRQNNFNIRNMCLFVIRTHTTINCAFHNVFPRTMRRYNLLIDATNVFNKPVKNFKQLWINRIIEARLNVFGTLLNSVPTSI